MTNLEANSSAAIGILTLNEFGIIKAADRNTGSMFGYEVFELVGQHVSFLLAGDHGEAKQPFATVKKFLEAAESHDESLGRRKNGESFYLQITVSELCVGSEAHLIAVLRDATKDKESERAVADHLPLTALAGDIGIAITRGRTVDDLLQRCAEAIVKHLDAAFARIWTINRAGDVLDLRASAGLYTHLNGTHAHIPFGKLKIGLIAEERIPHLTNSVLTDPRIGDTEWARQQGLISFAGHPLIVDGRLIGVMGLFARHALSNQVLDILAAIADGIAVGVERFWAYEDLYAAKVIAEAAARVKGDFLATMSHEIRTPMNGILGMADLLLNSDLGERQRKRTQTLRASAEALLSILNDILDFSKIEAKKLDLEMAEFNLRRVVEDVSDLMAVKAQEKGLELTCFIEPDVPTRRFGDSNRLRQILMNLIGNAVKFTATGEVSLRVSHGIAGQDGAVRFEVADTGVGVPAEARHLIFERFSQADASTARRYGGTGLGLSIVRGLVEMMGGQVGLISREGEGSTFWFTAALITQPPAKQPRALSLAGKRVLVVDDNAASRLVLLETVAIWQCEAEHATDADSALKRLHDSSRDSFDAVIVDSGITGLSGDLLGKFPGAGSGSPSMPIVLLTLLDPTCLSTNWESDTSARRVTKPVKQEELGAGLALALGIDPQIATPEARTDAKSNPFEVKSQYPILVVEDNPVNQEVVMGMLDHLGYQAKMVSSGRSALRALRDTPYTLVLTDCQMPEMDGYELSRLIRDPSSKVLNPQVPIVAVTAHSLAGDRERCLRAGMNDYLSKPIRPEILDGLLSRWIGPGSERRPSVELDRASRASYDTTDWRMFNRDDLVKRLMGDEDLARRVAKAYIDSMPQQLAALAEAIGRSDAQAIMSAAHSIKGAAANVGSMDVAEFASQMEEPGEAGAVAMASGVLSGLSAKFESLKKAISGFSDT